MGFFIYVMDNCEHKKFGFSSVLTERKMFQFGSVHCWTGSPLSEKLKSNENNNKKMENHYYEEGLGM